MEYNEKGAGNSFEKLLAEFVEKTGVKTDGAGPNSIDVIADDVMVSAQYRPDRDDCVIFALPVEDLELDERMLRRALAIAADGEGTHGHFLGMREGMLVLSSVVKPGELSAPFVSREARGALRRRVRDASSRPRRGVARCRGGSSAGAGRKAVGRPGHGFHAGVTFSPVACKQGTRGG